jgi:Glycosyltransferase family 87
MSFRRALTVVALVAVGVVLVGQVRKLLADPTIWPPDDFIEYWAAAKLTLDGDNPYDGDKLLPLQKANGRDTSEAVMMWNPPWAITVVLPLGLFPAREAQLLWLLVNLFAIGFCGDRLWRIFGGSPERRWLGIAIALAALPSIFALQVGQIGPILLLGAVLFLECEQRGYHFAAGAATVLLAIKPHLAYLVWCAILCDAVTRGRWRMLLGGAVVGLACAALPLIFDPHVWQQYADALGNRPPAQWVSPTLGTVLRLVFGEELFRLQFIPMLLGLAWFAWHWRKRSSEWNWTEQFPLLLLVSFVTAPYGAWPFDMVLLLPAAVWLVVKKCGPLAPRAGETARGASGPHLRGHFVLAGLVAVNLGCLAMNLLNTLHVMTITSFWFLWVSPAVLAIYVFGYPRTHVQGSSVPCSPGMVTA